MLSISAVDFNLTTLNIYNAVTQSYEDTTLTGYLYTVEGLTDVTGTELCRLSIAELVMVVCLARAAEKEATVIDIMGELEGTTDTLEGLTDVENRLLAGEALSHPSLELITTKASCSRMPLIS